MSEFSEVYFLRSSCKEDAFELLEKAGVAGYVFPERDGWVAFAADTRPLYQFSEKLKAVNTGILLQYVNAEDYGWGFEICAGQDSVCGYYCGISEDTGEFYCMKREMEEKRFKKIVEDNEEFLPLAKYFDENAKIEEISQVYDFTESMKLYFCSWISYQIAEMQNGEFPKYGEYENLKLIKVG